MEMKNKIIAGALVVSVGANIAMQADQQPINVQNLQEQSQEVLVVEAGQVQEFNVIEIDAQYNNYKDLVNKGWEGEYEAVSPMVLTNGAEQQILMTKAGYGFDKIDKESYDYADQIRDNGLRIHGELLLMKDINGKEIQPEVINNFMNDYYSQSLDYASKHNIEVEDNLQYLQLMAQGYTAAKYDSGGSSIMQSPEGQIVIADSAAFSVQNITPEMQELLDLEKQNNPNFEKNYKDMLEFSAEKFGEELKSAQRMFGEKNLDIEAQKLEFKEAIDGFAKNNGIDLENSKIEFNLNEGLGFEGDYNNDGAFSVMQNEHTGEFILVNHIKENALDESDISNYSITQSEIEIANDIKGSFNESVMQDLRELKFNGNQLPEEFIEKSSEELTKSLNDYYQFIQDNVPEETVAINYDQDFDFEMPNMQKDTPLFEMPTFGQKSNIFNKPDINSIYKKPKMS